MPKISVIVPVYNTEQFLSRCIDSVLAQTFTDFELLLIDDGSKDNSGKICDEYAAKDSRIRVFHKENGGVSSARNLGLDNALGEWITFVDSDDYLELRALKTLLQNDCEDLVIAAMRDQNNVIDLGSKDLKFAGKEKVFEFYRLNHDRNILMTGPICKLFKRDFILKNNIHFDEKLYLGEDTVFVFDYTTKCQSIKYIHSVCYNYDNPLLSYRNKYGGKIYEIIDFYNKYTDRCKEFGIYQLNQKCFNTMFTYIKYHISDCSIKECSKIRKYIITPKIKDELSTNIRLRLFYLLVEKSYWRLLKAYIWIIEKVNMVKFILCGTDFQQTAVASPLRRLVCCKNQYC